MRRRRRAALVLAGMLLSCPTWSCGTNSPTQPSSPQAATWKNLLHFEELVGTNWTGTARFTSAGTDVSAAADLAFLWESVSDQPYWGIAVGYSPHGWGTVDGVQTKVMGSSSLSLAGVYQRWIEFGATPAAGRGNWDWAQLAGDGQRLVISSSDFSWGDRRTLTIELTRTPWPAGLPCPRFRTCGP